ncbi:NADH-ubiquinone oxidoreductase B18 subunit-domain-containing protein [Hygrophoropsis aurantiaca]|uniref:NADH-ubiquinone oxidoreductase B18 subunit-domain-containing protein n=1 Tax=Hygrophoropsis aurantiaca TaxID=72124 RepID=A0ACB7ZPS5_9AGAM|nr:NADH-ubiquinone oxidoreductase B18 subunit-domain-containing protein [Hygrophoropsis aurantiaca]
MPSAQTASQEELKAAKVPIAWRDQCSALLIPLNTCRRKTLYMPWECNDERHTYEKCQYDDLMRRMREMSKLKLQQAEEAEEA